MNWNLWTITSFLLLQPVFSMALQSDPVVRDYLAKNLQVKVAPSCELIQKTSRDPMGPFQVTDKCYESDLKGIKALSGKVYRVVDGDTIHFYAKNKLYAIRMLGMDTPELHYLSTSQPRWGEVAKSSLQSLVSPGDTIQLQLDQVKCDRYGRILGHVFKGNTNLNFEQIRKGMAANYCIAPNMMHCQAYAMAYLKAQEERRGMHSDACVVTPYVWRRALTQTPMDKKVQNFKTGEIYSAKDYYLVPVAYRVFYP